MDQISICELLLKWNEIESFFKRFFTGKIKNGSRTTIIYEKDRSKMKLCKRWQIQDWRQEKWCWCVMKRKGSSCCRPVKRSILISTVNNWKDYVKQSRESDQNWSIRKASSSITITSDLTHFWQPVKNWENLVGKFWCIHLIVLTLHH